MSLLSFILSLFFFVSLCSASLATYDNPWGSIPTGLTAREVTNVDLGVCVCDLTLNSCDANCGCDSECSAVEKATFSSQLPFGPRPVTVYQCTDDELVKINARGGVTTQVLNNVLCVVGNNNPSLGTYFNPKTSLLPAEIVAQYSSNPYNFLNSAAYAKLYTYAAATYRSNDVLQRRQGASTGYFLVPGPDMNGGCTNSAPLRFLNESAIQCTRYFQIATTSLPATANGFGSVLLISPSLEYGKIPVPTSSDYDTILSGTISYTDITGVSSTITPPATDPSATLSGADCRVTQAMKSIVFTFYHDGSGSIRYGTYDIQFVDIQAPVINGLCALSITQTFSAVYRFADPAVYLTLPPATPLPITRAKSGNPGYRNGAPVLTGIMHTQSGQTAIKQTIGAFPLFPRPSSGVCPFTYPSSGLVGTPLNFNEDLYMGCRLQLTSSNNLQDICQGTNPIIQQYLNMSVTYLGAWGNSDYANLNDWIGIQPDTTLSSITGAWDNPTLTCTGLVNSLSLRIIVANFGAVSNPQPAIISAQLTHSTTDWTYSATTDSVPISFSVQWIWLDNQGQLEYLPSAPPLLPKFPNDLLYPLFVPGAAGPSLHSLSSPLTLLLCAAIALIGTWIVAA